METIEKINIFPSLAKLGIKGNLVKLLNAWVDEICDTGPGANVSDYIPLKMEKTEQMNDIAVFSKIFEDFRILTHMVFREKKYKKVEGVFLELQKILSYKKDDIPKVKAVTSVLFRRMDDIQQTFMNQTVTSLSNWHLQDFDWRLHVVVSSDMSSNVREYVVLLTLYVENENQKKKGILIELDERDLDGLLNDFGQIERVLDSL